MKVEPTWIGSVPFKKQFHRNLPDNSVVKTLCFRYKGCRFDLWLENWDCACCTVKKKKKDSRLHGAPHPSYHVRIEWEGTLYEEEGPHQTKTLQILTASRTVRDQCNLFISHPGALWPMRSSTQENWGLICNGGSRSPWEATAWLEMKDPTWKGKPWPILLIDQEQQQTSGDWGWGSSESHFLHPHQ